MTDSVPPDPDCGPVSAGPDSANIDPLLPPAPPPGDTRLASSSRTSTQEGRAVATTLQHYNTATLIYRRHYNTLIYSTLKHSYVHNTTTLKHSYIDNTTTL